jgi:16S rRNA (cytosine967-C5)-methyltransferase
MPRQLVDLSREQALKILRRTETALSFPKLLLAGAEEAPDSGRARAFVYQLVMGTLRYRNTLDWALAGHCTTPIEDLSPWIRNILRMGLYQILYLDRVPKSAAVDESVKLAKKYGHAGTAGLVNAVLRNAHREEILPAIESLREDSPSDIAIKYSHPQWLVEALIADWGVRQAIEILKNNLAIPPITARVNSLRTTRPHLIEMLSHEGVKVSPVQLYEEAIEFFANGSPSNLSAHKQGLFYFQDVSSMFASVCLEPEPGQKVLDACAGPGGKAAHMAALMRNQGKIYALDVHEHRVKLVEENAKRLGASIIEAKVQDATGALAETYPDMDRVLIDAPCSGVGVIRRRVDLKWRLQPGQIEGLVRLQSEILESASECVRPGGLLVYCTCTVFKKENPQVINEFLLRHPDFRADPAVPKALGKYLTEEGFVQILPGNDGMDGFFIARLKRL